jgi:predicted CXXCH cytochrome family protein
MHYSQNGTRLSEWGTSGPYTTLLINNCLGCHSSADSSTYYDLDGCKFPVVLYTGGEPTEYLAGGNFYWVKEGLGGDDTKGHNVFLGEPDDNLSNAPGDVPTGPHATCNGVRACHRSLSNSTNSSEFSFNHSRQGCTKCHMIANDPPQGLHHLDDSGDPKIVNSAAQGWYRFLSGHETGAGYGVAGIEDDDWQATVSDSDHNEYLGEAADKTSEGGFGYIGENTMTAYCTGCHGIFHEQDTTASGSSPWLRHPSDAVLPSSGEYSAYTTYDPVTPVARPNLTSISNQVTPSIDMVMCLSCHRPHSSPYPDMLRWDYSGMIAGSSSASGGCFNCHTQKNQLP